MARLIAGIILGLGLVFWVLGQIGGQGPRSPLWFVEPALYAVLVPGLILGGFGWRPARPGLAFVLLSLLCGAVYELSLTVDGTGLGGVHPRTWPSFALAFGDYLMIALATWAMVARWHLDVWGAIWIAAGKSMTEGLIFTGVLAQTLAAGQLGAALLAVSYYTLAYAGFVALPLVVLSPSALWRGGGPGRALHPVLLIGAGFVVALAIRLVWGLVYAPLVTAALGLPPNPVP
jgi:hypothetical protein